MESVVVTRPVILQLLCGCERLCHAYCSQTWWVDKRKGCQRVEGAGGVCSSSSNKKWIGQKWRGGRNSDSRKWLKNNVDLETCDRIFWKIQVRNLYIHQRIFSPLRLSFNTELVGIFLFLESFFEIYLLRRLHTILFSNLYFQPEKTTCFEGY